MSQDLKLSYRKRVKGLRNRTLANRLATELIIKQNGNQLQEPEEGQQRHHILDPTGLLISSNALYVGKNSAEQNKQHPSIGIKTNMEIIVSGELDL